MMDEIARIDRALDELLVNLGDMVLRLGRLSTTDEENRALVRSVQQFSSCALASKDGRVRTLAAQLEATLPGGRHTAARPKLRLVISR